MKLLLVEDEPEMVRVIRDLLVESGFVVDCARTLQECLAFVSSETFDLIILDRRLPDGEGLSIISTIREKLPGTRIIVLSALDKLQERVSGLDAGADDYISKPFEPEELLARFRALLRRPGASAMPVFNIGRLKFDPSTLEVFFDETPVVLNRRELLLFESLIRRSHRVVSRSTLLSDVYSLDEGVQENTLDALVSRLRKKIISMDCNVSLHTIKGLGYMLTEQQDS
jgi:two-component system OmpR family response regulator